MTRLLVSVFYVGFLAPASGTWGSLAALPLAWALHILGGPVLLLASIVVVFFAGVWATSMEIGSGADHDPSYIVIDEVVGQWIALLPVSFGAALMSVSPARLWPGIVVAFLAFRLFDIWKPWLIGQADRRGDALGVMLDDVGAGIFAAIVVGLLAVLGHRIVAG